jgi:hypothetical protein
MVIEWWKARSESKKSDPKDAKGEGSSEKPEAA